MICNGSIEGTATQNNKRFTNWSRAINFTASQAFRPGSRSEIVEIVRLAEERGQRVKAVGSLWSFTEAFRSDEIIIETDLLNNDIERTVLDVLPLTDTAIAERDRGDLVHVQAGMKVRELNLLLHRSRILTNCFADSKALPTLGGSGGQSIAGVISTGSHGGDVDLPPIADAIAAIHLIGPGGQEWWIEPASGITSGTDADVEAAIRTAVETTPSLSTHLCEHMIVRKDDALFRSAMVMAGRMGIVYSYVLRVVPCFKLTETRSGSDWLSFRSSVSADGLESFLSTGGFRHLGIVINPFRNAGGSFDCVITTRTVAPASAPITPPSTTPDIFGYFCRQPDITPIAAIIGGARAAVEALFAAVLAIPPPPPPSPDPITTIIWLTVFETTKQATLGALRASAAILDHLLIYLARPGVTIGDVIAEISNASYAVGLKDQMRELLRTVFSTLYPSAAPPRTDLSWKIMDTYDYQAECYKVDSMEFAFDALDADSTTHYFGFIDEVIMIIEEMFGRNVPVAGILALRYTSATSAFMGMSQFRRTCHIEIPVLSGLRGNEEFIRRVQEAAKRFNGIPHWGQIMDQFSGSDTARNFRNHHQWQLKLGELIRGGDGRDNTFSNTFTRTNSLEPVYPIRIPDRLVEICVMALSALGERERRSITTIRAFKKEILPKSAFGRFIIRFYRWVSPGLARIVYKSDVLKRITYYVLVKPAEWIALMFHSRK